MRTRSLSKENEIANLCSSQCYLSTGMIRKHEHGVQNGIISGSSTIKGANKQLSIDVNSSIQNNVMRKSRWTPHEESIFNLLRVTGEEDYCRYVIRMMYIYSF